MLLVFDVFIPITLFYNVGSNAFLLFTFLLTLVYLQTLYSKHKNIYNIWRLHFHFILYYCNGNVSITMPCGIWKSFAHTTHLNLFCTAYCTWARILPFRFSVLTETWLRSGRDVVCAASPVHWAVCILTIQHTFSPMLYQS